jgi:hypothetical protein
MRSKDGVVYETECDCLCGTRFEVNDYGSGNPFILGVSVRGEDVSLSSYAYRRSVWTGRIRMALKEAWGVLRNDPQWHEVLLRDGEVEKLTAVLLKSGDISREDSEL